MSTVTEVLGLVPTIERALEFLSAGDQDDAKASIELALEKAQEQAETLERASPVPGFQITDILGHADGNIGRFLQTGKDLDRRGAIDEAIENAHALTDLLSAINENQAVIDATSPGSIGTVAYVAQSLLERVQYLRHDDYFKGHTEDSSDE